MNRRGMLLLLALLIAATAFAADFHDDFAAGLASWSATRAWSAAKTPAGHPCLRADAPGDSFAWRKDWPLQPTFSLAADFSIARLLGDKGASGAASLALSTDAANPGPGLLATVLRASSGACMITLEYLDGSWHPLLSSGWLPGADTAFHLALSRQAGDDFLHLAVTGDQGLSYASDSPPAPLALLDGVCCLGLRANRAVVDFTSASASTPSPPAAFYRLAAERAVHDLLVNYWVGGATDGHIVDTYNGYPARVLPEKRGVLWERGTMLMDLAAMYGLTHDPALLARIRSDWRRTKSAFTPAELRTAGTHLSPACDDCGWNALSYLAVYRATGDPAALADSRGMVVSALDRWDDDTLGGGLWYNDERKVKSLYGASVVLAAMEVADATHDGKLRARARACYDWMERRLLRPDGLYWCDLGADGPVGKERPGDIHEAGSVTFLAGDMAMGVLHARLFHLTGDDKFRQRALRTAAALAAHLTDGHGVLLDDRDAWTDGTFAVAWARDVLSLPGCPKSDADLLRATARAITLRDRTSDGHYGGCWNGPADGPGSRWSCIGSRPQQIMTSANAAAVVIAAAYLEK